MYRSLVIGLGESFRPVCQRIEASLEAEIDSGGAEDVQLSTIRLFRKDGAADEGRPFEEELHERSLEALTDLLGMTASQTSSRPWLDVFLLVDLGEEGPRSVLRDSIEELTSVVRDNFEAIFPSFKRGVERRVRIIPISIIGAHGASERDPVLEKVRDIETWIADQHTSENGNARDCLVDRFFVLDGVTPRGLVPKEALLDQVSNVLELALLGGMRREEPFTSLLEYGGDEICGTFSSAVWRIDTDHMHDRLGARLSRRIVASLLEGGATTEFDFELSDHLLRDDTLFEEYLERIRSTPEETFRNQGPAAVVDLADTYADLLDDCQKRRSNLENERDGLQEKLESDGDDGETDSASSSASSGGILGSLFGSVLLGGIVFGLAAFGVGLALLASAFVSGGIALVGAVVLYFLLQSSPQSSESTAGRDEGDSTERELDRVESHLERVETLHRTLREAYVPMRALEEALRALEPASDASTDTPKEDGGDVALPVRTTVRSEALEDALFESFLPWSSVGTAATAFVREHVKPLEEWSEGDRLDQTVLQEFTHEAFEDVRSEDLFRDRAVRDAVADSLRDFLETWSDGLPLFLDLRSRRQYDPDGFLSPFDQRMIAPGHLEQFARELLDDLDSPIEVESGLAQGDRAYLLHTVVDIHPRAMPQPSSTNGDENGGEAPDEQGTDRADDEKGDRETAADDDDAPQDEEASDEPPAERTPDSEDAEQTAAAST